jgi:glycosyltransferase involved in cell wall biosynthesis
MNILLISHCDFSTNHALHVSTVASTLRKFGADTAVAMPNDVKSVRIHGKVDFQLLHYDEAARNGAVFPDGRGPDIVHAWTPREHVRKFTESLVARHGCRYIVHLEDNEEAIVSDELEGYDFEELAGLPVRILDEVILGWRSHPQRAKAFLAGAAGVTALIEPLLEFKPEGVPGLVFWPGFDPNYLKPAAGAALREKYNIPPDAHVPVYTGSIHKSNEVEVTNLIIAVGLLHRKGIPIRLIKTGWNHAAKEILSRAAQAGYLIDLGSLPRGELASVVELAEVLVQPGRPNRFNDYRFPAKLPEYLVTGKPVILPQSNLGRHLTGGVNCLLLDKGDPIEIASKIELLLNDRELAEKIGAAGKEFAHDKLDWTKNVGEIAEFYREVLRRPVPSVPSDKQLLNHEPPVKAIAFYLPQFHPVPENDEWWGEGFTEWTNVTKTVPVFEGHHQPQLPADLGFYDLRVPEVLEKQADLARRYGIYGFCFYYYWFNGRRILERPLDQMMKRGKPDFPFCVCWANENWTRAWDGSVKEILLEQHYSTEADFQLIDDLIPLFEDPRYIRVDGAPLFLVYRASDIPDVKASIVRWRARCAERGIAKVHIAMVQSFGNIDPRPAGFDSAVEFPPHVKHRLVPPDFMPTVDPEFRGYMEDYLALATDQVSLPLPPFVRYRGAMMAWDNSARRGKNAHIVIRSSPGMYQRLFSRLVEQTMQLRKVQEPLLFINAWNEWAEGTHLEPDRRYGKAWLEATFQACVEGIANYFRNSGLRVANENIQRALSWVAKAPAQMPLPQGEKGAKTEHLIDQEQLQHLKERYAGKFFPARLSYSTTEDYRDSVDHLQNLAALTGDLRDIQRPWMIKAVLGTVPIGGRILEIGAGEPVVSDILSRLGYEVWIADPYDRPDNGQVEFTRYLAEYPDIRFLRDPFGDELMQPPAKAFDCIFSISRQGQPDSPNLTAVARGLKKFLKRNGIAILTVDHVRSGQGAFDHLVNLERICDKFGHSREQVRMVLDRADTDIATYHVSIEGQTWQQPGDSSEQSSTRRLVSIQVISGAENISTGSC